MRVACISIGLVVFMGCRPNISQQTESESLPMDFVEFYTQFHTDSAFQMSRIVFPLNTKTPTDSTNSDFWMPEDWQLHELGGFSKDEYDHEFEKLSDGYIVELHKHKQLPFAVVRRWLKLREGWKLSYYEVKQGQLGGGDQQ